jgi:quercetin dioxygenase-like cupin family protein
VQHSHEDADETLYVLEGTPIGFLDGQRRDVGPGAYLFIPRGRVRSTQGISNRSSATSD